MPTTVIRCPNSIPCLGIDSLDGDYPIRNLSAEEPDVPLYYCTVYASPRPPLGGACGSFTTLALAASSTSQADACELAQLIADAAACPGSGVTNEDPQNSDEPQPPPPPPCDDGGSCDDNQTCVNGQCVDNQGVNDFSPVGTNPRRPFAPIVLSDLAPSRCCIDNTYAGLITAEGYEPFLWRISVGLPPGLAFSKGLITGTPTVKGTFNFTVTVQAADGGRESRDYTLNVCDIDQDSPLSSGQVLEAYSESLTQTGGVPPISWQISDGALPPGLSLDESTGIISGTPPATIGGLPNDGGTYTFTVLLQDEAT